MTGMVPVNKELLTGTVPVNKILLSGTVLVNNFYLFLKLTPLIWAIEGQNND